MSKQTEDEFLADFEAGMARMVARECYRAIHPGGMHTNGPTLVNIEVSRLLYVLSRWKKQPNQEPTAEGALKDLRQRLGMETCEQCRGARFVSSYNNNGDAHRVPCSACNAMGESPAPNR